jgi:hypothetical protein
MAKYFSSAHEPLYRFGQWQANLRILEVKLGVDRQHSNITGETLGVMFAPNHFTTSHWLPKRPFTA